MTKPIEEDYSLAGELLGIEDIMYEMTAEVYMYIYKLNLPKEKLEKVIKKINEDEKNIGFSRTNAHGRLALRDEYRGYLQSNSFKLDSEIIFF
jgi:hypothetical protein